MACRGSVVLSLLFLLCVPPSAHAGRRGATQLAAEIFGETAEENAGKDAVADLTIEGADLADGSTQGAAHVAGAKEDSDAESADIAGEKAVATDAETSAHVGSEQNVMGKPPANEATEYDYVKANVEAIARNEVVDVTEFDEKGGQVAEGTALFYLVGSCPYSLTRLGGKLCGRQAIVMSEFGFSTASRKVISYWAKPPGDKSPGSDLYPKGKKKNDSKKFAKLDAKFAIGQTDTDETDGVTMTFGVTVLNGVRRAYIELPTGEENAPQKWYIYLLYASSFNIKSGTMDGWLYVQTSAVKLFRIRIRVDANKNIKLHGYVFEELEEAFPGNVDIDS
jgi:hypothetical protein